MAKTLKKKTKTWIELAANDLDLARSLLSRENNYYYSAYFCHQAIEKMLKAIVTQRTDNAPFPTHNFKILLDQAGISSDIPDNRKRLIFSLTPHYIGTKYPEDITKLYKSYTLEFTKNLFNEVRELFIWLKVYLK